jgi:hypothetical protein
MFPGTKTLVFMLDRISLLSFAPGTSLKSQRYYENDYHNSHTRMETPPPSLPSKIDLAIIGAGPHALTLITHLL